MLTKAFGPERTQPNLDMAQLEVKDVGELYADYGEEPPPVERWQDEWGLTLLTIDSRPKSDLLLTRLIDRGWEFAGERPRSEEVVQGLLQHALQYAENILEGHPAQAIVVQITPHYPEERAKSNLGNVMEMGEERLASLVGAVKGFPAPDKMASERVDRALYIAVRLIECAKRVEKAK